MWGAERPRPEGDLRRFYDLAMEGIAESGIAVEVSTAGLRKPVGELYPDRGVPRDGRSTPATRSRCRATRTRPTSSASATSEALELLDDLGVHELARLRAARAAPGADRRVVSVTTGIGWDSTASPRAGR